jgi:hypothetical protein
MQDFAAGNRLMLFALRFAMGAFDPGYRQRRFEPVEISSTREYPSVRSSKNAASCVS